MSIESRNGGDRCSGYWQMQDRNRHIRIFEDKEGNKSIVNRPGSVEITSTKSTSVENANGSRENEPVVVFESVQEQTPVLASTSE